MNALRVGMWMKATLKMGGTPLQQKMIFFTLNSTGLILEPTSIYAEKKHGLCTSNVRNLYRDVSGWKSIVSDLWPMLSSQQAIYRLYRKIHLDFFKDTEKMNCLLTSYVFFTSMRLC